MENKTELMDEFRRLGCLNVENKDDPKCKKILDLLMNNESFNNSNHNQSTNVTDYGELTFVVITSYSLGIFLNCLLLWMMYKDPLKRFRTSSSLLLANLAVSDFLGACFSLGIENEISKNPNYSSSILTSLYLPWLVATTAQSSYYIVMLVSFDRYAAIAHPFRYRDFAVTKYTLLVIITAWLFAFAISTPLFFIPDIHRNINPGNKIYAINTFILIAIILVLYPLTHSSLRRQRKQVLTMNGNNNKLRINKLKVEKDFANTMFLVCIALVLFSCPHIVAFYFRTTECNSCITDNNFQTVWQYFRIFIALHFGVNPIIYALRLPCYRESLLALFPVFKKYQEKVRKQRMPRTTTVQSHEKRQHESSTHIETPA